MEIDFRLKNNSGKVITESVFVDFWSESEDPSDYAWKVKKDLRAKVVWPLASIVDPVRGDAVNAVNAVTYVVPLDEGRPLFPNGVSHWNTLRFRVSHPYEMYFSVGHRVRLSIDKCPLVTGGSRHQ